MLSQTIVSKTTLAIASLLVALSGCQSMAIHGTGRSFEVRHDVSQPGTVEVNGSGELHLRNGSPTELIVIAQEEIHEHLSIRYVGDRLIIEPIEGVHFRSDEPVQYILVSDDVRQIELSGAINLYSEAYHTERLHIDASGASDIDATVHVQQLSIDASGAFDGYLAGSAESLSLDFSGAADLNSYDLDAQHVSIDLSGAGSAYVSASETLDVSVSGASTVGYKGNPRISQSTTGASRVFNAD